MEFLVDRNKFFSALSFAGKAIPSRASHPVLANVLMDVAEEGRISIAGFDLSVAATASLDADVQQPGQVTLPYKLLHDIVSRLTAPVIRFEAIESDGGCPIVKVTADSGSYRINGMSADEYPSPPRISKSKGLELAGEDLLRGFDVCYAASSDETKQVLNSVNLKTKEGEAVFAAIDGHRMAIGTIPLEDGAEIEPINIPARLSRFFGHIKNDRVQIGYEQGMAIFEWGDYSVSTRLLDGLYPNYEQLFPASFERSIHFDRSLAIQCIDRVAAIDTKIVVKFHLDMTSITFELDSPGAGSAKETMPAILEGESMTLAFNPKYFTEALRHLDGETIVMRLNTPASAVVLTSDVEGQKVLLMPVQIRS
mgnify:FL=1